MQQTEEEEEEEVGETLWLLTSLSIALFELVTEPVELLLVRRGNEQIRLFFKSQLRLQLLLKLQNDFDDFSASESEFAPLVSFSLCFGGDGCGGRGDGDGEREEVMGGSSYL